MQDTSLLENIQRQNKMEKTNKKSFHPECVACFLLFLSIREYVKMHNTQDVQPDRVIISYNVPLFKATNRWRVYEQGW